MPFTLRISFTGMCLFVRDGDAMHVLMPGTPGSHTASRRGQPNGHTDHGGSTGTGTGNTAPSGSGAGEHGATESSGAHMEPHTALLVFDTAHLRPHRVQIDGISAMVPLRNHLLEIRGGSGFIGELPGDLVQVGRAIKPEVFDSRTAQDLLTSRVTLHSGRCTDHDPGACWEWMDGPRAMSHVVEWSIDDLPGDFLEQTMGLLGGSTGERLGPLYPVNGVVALEVWHVPPSELPQMGIQAPAVPHAGQEAHHFSAYDRLLQTPVGRLPRFSAITCSTPGRGKFRDKGRVGYSCISAAL